MIKTVILAASALALAASGEVRANAAEPADVAAPEGQRWSEVVRRTQAGGYLMGNPQAPVKVIEYASLTCNHCAHFAAEGEGPLKADYVDSGRVSFEFRNYTLELLEAVVRFCIWVEMQIKHICRSARPVHYASRVQPMIQTPDHSTFPSGHATEAFAVLNAARAVAPPSMSKSDLREAGSA